MTREVTEEDFRKPEFRGARASDYEFDGTGMVVRKDRWETSIRKIVGMLEDHGVASLSRKSFTQESVLLSVEMLLKALKESERPVLTEEDAVVHIFPHDLERIQSRETSAVVFSVPCGSPDGNTVPLFTLEQIKGTKQ